MEKGLDSAYDALLGQLKPLVLKQHLREDRQRIASWIKKFNEPNEKDPSWKKTRNLYAHLLKTMLARGNIEAPFSGKPPISALAPLPSYMTMFLEGSNADSGSERHLSTDDNSTMHSQSKRKITYSPKKTASLPDLSAMSTDDESDDDISNLLRGPTHRPPTPTSFSIPKRFTSTPGPLKSGEQSVHIPVKQPTAATSHTIPNFKGIVEKEVQMKERLLSNRYTEEKMKLQRHHDELLQKILDKKTKEVEEFRSEYRNKVMQLENNNKALERRIQQMQEEMVRLREQKERQAFDYKNSLAQDHANMKAEWEKRMSRLQDQNEEGQIKQHEEHQVQLQKLIDDTTQTMTKMEEEYKTQAESMAAFLKECEEKNLGLRSDLDTLKEEKRKVEEKRGDLEMELSTLNTQLKHGESRIKELEKELESAEQHYVSDLEQHKKSSESASQLAKQEFSYTISKAQEAHTVLEQQLKECQESEEATRALYENKLWDLESKNKAELAKLERGSEKRLRSAEKAAEKKLTDSKNEVAELKKQLRAKEKEIVSMGEAQKLQTLKAEKSLQELRKEMQANTDRLYREVQEQVKALEEDLEKEAHQRERVEADYKQKISEEKLKYDENVAELQMSHEREKQQLIEKYHEEIEGMQKKFDEEKKFAEDDRLSEITESERRGRLRLSNEIQRSEELKGKVESLTEELSAAKSSHKKHTAEVQAAREKEKKQSATTLEKQLASHKAEVEELRKKHTKEIEKLTMKTNSKMKLIEVEFNERFQTNSEMLEKAQAASSQHQEETKRQAVMYERSIKKLHQEVELAKADERQRQREIIKSLEQEVETQRNMIRHLEKKRDMLELEMQEKIARTKLIYEEKMKGSVSQSVREELEETISALKAQSSILEQKATILQSELDHRSHRAGSPYLRAKA